MPQQLRVNYLVFGLHRLITEGEELTPAAMVDVNRLNHKMSNWGFIDIRNPEEGVNHMLDIIQKFIDAED